MTNNKKILLIQMIGFFMSGLLFARLYLDNKKIQDSILDFDVIMMFGMILAIFIIAIGLKRTKD
jgi:hypothetical protein